MDSITSSSNQLRAANMVLTLFTCGAYLPIWIGIEIYQALRKPRVTPQPTTLYRPPQGQVPYNVPGTHYPQDPPGSYRI